MAIEVLHDQEKRQAVLICTTSGVAFGPVFSDTRNWNSGEIAEAFLQWNYAYRDDDPRMIAESTLLDRRSDFESEARGGNLCACGRRFDDHVAEPDDRDTAPESLVWSDFRCPKKNEATAYFDPIHYIAPKTVLHGR